jgi:hypothetical protein
MQINHNAKTYKEQILFDDKVIRKETVKQLKAYLKKIQGETAMMATRKKKRTLKTVINDILFYASIAIFSAFIMTTILKINVVHNFLSNLL